jgi:hypothetical protein
MTPVIDVPPFKAPAKAGQVVDPRLDEHVAEIRRLGKRVMADVIEIGRRLAECREIVREHLGHGHWYAWLKDEFGRSDQDALNCIRAFNMSKSQNFLGLDLPVSAVYALAAPTTPKPVRDEIFERARAGDKVLVADVKKAIAEAKVGEAARSAEGKGKKTVNPVVQRPKRTRRSKQQIDLEGFGKWVSYLSATLEYLQEIDIPPLDVETGKQAVAQLEEGEIALHEFIGRIKRSMLVEQDEFYAAEEAEAA